MREFYQSIMGLPADGGPPEGWGDCTRTAIASLLELDPKSLPNPHDTGIDWGLEWKAALAKHGIVPIWFGDMTAWWRLGFPGYWMATVDVRQITKNERDDNHTVVMLFDRLAHDPFPGSVLNETPAKELKAAIVHATIFVPVDPKKGVHR